MSSVPDTKILLIGAGNMGKALLGAWLKQGWNPHNITVVEPHPAAIANGVTLLPAIGDVAVAPDCVVLAVKPQSLDALLPELARKFSAKPLYLSIAAGKTLRFFEKHLGDTAAVVRAMPNTPALIGKGISALAANAKVTSARRELANALLSAAGKVVWLDDEKHMDAVTALSGSGPAYVFLFLEALIEAGRAEGLSDELARTLAVHTVAGSALLAAQSKEPLGLLRENVTSKGGTTEAALQKFAENGDFKTLVKSAVAAAVKRSKELA